jgi:transcriptional regulator with XRE-family HTH domain
MNFISQNIKRIRESKHLTQDYVGSRLGISQNAYSRIENNRTRLTTERMREIARILNVSLHELLVADTVHEHAGKEYLLSLAESQKENYGETITILKAEIEHLRRENIRLVEMLDEKISKRL